MKKRWIASFALSLGFWATTARAGDDAWRVPVSKPANPAAQIGRPIVLDSATPAPMPSLGDTQIRPTGYNNAPLTPPPLMPAHATDIRPMPVGTAAAQGSSILTVPPQGPAVSMPPAIKPM